MPPPELKYPRLPHTAWSILGLDLSLTRTGFATLSIDGSEASWLSVGSIKPKHSEQETWLRAAALGVLLRDKIQGLMLLRPEAPIVVALELPDPFNSYLMGLNQVIQTVLWPAGYHPAEPTVYRLALNASTLRSVLRLSKSQTKEDNKELAYQYVTPEAYPSLDTDSCDAVLLAMMGRHAAMVLAGYEDLVPMAPRTTLCSMELKTKTRKDSQTGEKVTTKVMPAGLLHRPDTWTVMASPYEVELSQYDASLKRPKASPISLYL